MKYSEYEADRAQKSILRIYDLRTAATIEIKRFDRVVEAPNWSKDGRSLFVNGQGKIWKVELASGKVEQVDTGIADTCNNDHVLSPDGAYIAVSSGQQDDMNSNIYTVRLADGHVTKVVSEPFSYLHGWSKDGVLAFCGGRMIDGEARWDVYTVPSEGGVQTRLTDAPGLNDGPEFSADGKKMWFNSLRTGNMQVYVMNADGSDQKQMTFDEDMRSWFPHISPDMKKVVYVAYHAEDIAPGDHLPDKNIEIRMIPAAGGKPETLLKLFGGQGTMNVNSWSPDSNKFAFVSYE